MHKLKVRLIKRICWMNQTWTMQSPEQASVYVEVYSIAKRVMSHLSVTGSTVTLLRILSQVEEPCVTHELGLYLTGTSCLKWTTNNRGRLLKWTTNNRVRILDRVNKHKLKQGLDITCTRTSSHQERS
jgi:hypothetical protein